MKNPIRVLAIVAMLSFSSTIYASQLFNEKEINMLAQSEKTEITVDELPEIVREGFNLSDYSSMAISKIYKVVDQNGTITYEFILGDNNDTVIFSEEGKVVE